MCEYKGANKTSKTMIDLVCLVVVVSVSPAPLKTVTIVMKNICKGLEIFRDNKCTV